MSTQKTEHWKPIPGWEECYEVSDHGRLRNLNGLLRKQNLSNKGYLRCGLQRPGEFKTIAVHRLVAAAFIGPCPPGKQVNHKDGNKVNNRPENLEYVTCAENIQHACRVLGQRLGSKNVNAVITESQAVEIREARQRGESVKALAERFDLKPHMIYDVSSGRTWNHVDAAPVTNGKYVQLTEDEAAQIKTMLAEKVPVAEIAERFSASVKAVNRIRYGETFKHVLPA